MQAVQLVDTAKSGANDNSIISWDRHIAVEISIVDQKEENRLVVQLIDAARQDLHMFER